MDEKDNILELRDITKIFPEVIANDSICLTIRRGEIHALVGENGAGKSTLINILSGIHKPDRGDIWINEQLIQLQNPLDSFRHGISTVHQEFMLIGSLTVLENIVLGYEPKKYLGFLNKHKAKKEIDELSEKYGLSVPLDAIVNTLPVVIRQHVEILKALYKNTKIIILDEPTAVLAPQEVVDLFEVLKNFKSRGTTIIFVTHKLNEVLEIADRVTVMRRGQIEGTLEIAEASKETLAKMMVGRDVVFRINRLCKEILYDEPAVIEVKDLSFKNVDGLKVVDNVDLKVSKGEILGVAGVAGNGQTELVEMLTGFKNPDSGKFRILNESYSFISTNRFRRSASYVCQDRIERGSSPEQSIWENIIIGLQNQSKFSTRFGILNRKQIATYAHTLIDKFDVRAASINTHAGNLSGGNLQKLILARELGKEPEVLIAEDPTRGLDVGAAEYVRKQILNFAANKKTVLLVSQDLNELLMLSDRIIVMFKGAIVGDCVAAEATPESIGMYMIGLKKDS